MGNMRCTKTVRKLALLGFLFVVETSRLSAAAQEKARREKDQQAPALRTQANVVLVPALVKDAKGKLVFGLQTSGVEYLVRKMG